MKEKIIELVDDFGPIKSTELIVRLFDCLKLAKVDINGILDELVVNGDIIEVCYTLPSMTYREKSLYFPKGTIINLTK